MQKKPNRATTLAHDGQVIAGINKDLQNVAQLPLDGATYTPTSLVAQIQSRIDAANEAEVAHAKFIDATKAYWVNSGAPDAATGSLMSAPR